jgi:hypothetical protein
MKLLGLASLEHWLPALARHTGRTEDVVRANGLLASDFPMAGVLVEAEDGAILHFKHAFAVREEGASEQVAIFTEHNGYLAMKLTKDDTLHELSSREVLRWPGNHHCIPFLPCPLCGQEVDVVEMADTQSYEVDCPGCDLHFGAPEGYGSCLTMAYEWNRRALSSFPEGE